MKIRGKNANIVLDALKEAEMGANGMTMNNYVILEKLPNVIQAQDKSEAIHVFRSKYPNIKDIYIVDLKYVKQLIAISSNVSKCMSVTE